jgi:FkbM family methyltransferase
MIARLLQLYARGPDHPAKLRIFDWLCALLAPGKRLRLRVAGGLKMRLNPADLVDRALIFRDGHEELTTRFLFDNLKPGDTALVAGAHIGYHVLQIGRIVGPAGRVIACEPEPAHLCLAREHVEANGLAERVRLVSLGLSDKDGYAGFSASTPGNSGAATLDDAPAGAGLLVGVTTISGLLANLRVPALDLLLLDVEGFERRALAGLGEHRPRFLIVESDPRFHERLGEDQESFFAFVRGLGYRLHAVDGSPVRSPGFYPETNLVAVRADQPSPRWPSTPA